MDIEKIIPRPTGPIGPTGMTGDITRSGVTGPCGPSKTIIDPIIIDRAALHKPSKPTTWEEVRKLNLIERIKASNNTAWTKGVGLAAVQIGVYLRMSWFMDPDTKQEWTLVNPKITKADNLVVAPKEGCLSIPDTWTMTRRYNNITVANDVENTETKEPEVMTFTGFFAIVVQHEIDHMDGILNVQRRYIPQQVAGRNDPCPCKSGKKYKKCCINKIQQPGKTLEPVKEIKP